MLCQFLPRSGTRDGSRGLVSSMLSQRGSDPQERPRAPEERDALQLSRNPSHSFCSKGQPGAPTDQKATKSTHPQPLFPNQDEDNRGKIPINQLMRIAVFPSQGSSWLNNSLYPPISLHHLSSSFKSTQYFLNPQVLTGSGKKKKNKEESAYDSLENWLMSPTPLSSLKLPPFHPGPPNTSRTATDWLRHTGLGEETQQARRQMDHSAGKKEAQGTGISSRCVSFSPIPPQISPASPGQTQPCTKRCWDLSQRTRAGKQLGIMMLEHPLCRTHSTRPPLCQQPPSSQHEQAGHEFLQQKWVCEGAEERGCTEGLAGVYGNRDKKTEHSSFTLRGVFPLHMHLWAWWQHGRHG